MPMLDGVPPTSREALARVTARGERHHHGALVLAAVWAHPGSTAIELLDHVPLDEYQVRRRLTDLKDAGRVQRGPARPCTVRGSRMVTWWPVPEQRALPGV